MTSTLTKYQRSIAQHRITFDHLLSPELEESLRRASLAGAENKKAETGIIEFVCGLYLQWQKELADQFRGDFATVLNETFPKHRFGIEDGMRRPVSDGMLYAPKLSTCSRHR